MPANRKHAILVVDDEPEILQSLKGLLRMEFEVHTARSGLEALEVLQRQPVDVVMTDQRMPQMTGVEFLMRVQGRWPDALRMIFTGYADVKSVIDGINEGRIFRYITKPWDPDELIAVLRHACEEHDRIVARKNLLTALRAHHQRCQAALEGLRDGRLGNLAPEGEAEVEQLLRGGAPLQEQLEQALAS